MNNPDRSEDFEKEGKSLVTDPKKDVQTDERKWPDDFRGFNIGRIWKPGEK